MLQKSLKPVNWLVMLVAISVFVFLAVGCKPTTSQVSTPTTTEAAPAATQVVAPIQPATASGECTPSGEVKRGGELVLARLEEPLTFDPVGPSDNGSIYLIENVIDTLILPDATGAGLRPGLAESWEISNDGLVYTFHLRPAKFSNGEPVTTADVVFSLGRAADEKVSPYAFLFQSVQKIEAIDDKTVVVTLKEPFTPFLSAISVFTAGIIPQKVFEADPEGFGNKPVGSGAWVVEEYIRGDRVVLVPNPYYWGLGVDCKKLPYLDKVTVRYVPESNSRVLGLRNGDFQAIDNVPFSEGKSFESETDFILEVGEIYKLDYLYINHQVPPLDNKDFRLALNYATDRQAILDTVFFGYGQLPNGFTPKMNFWDKNVPLIPYDPAKAKELVQKSGYDGKVIEIMVPAGDAPRKQTATILKQNWAAVGINADIIELDIGAAWEKVTKGEYEVEVNYITSDINDDDELATFQGDFWAAGDSHAFYSWYQNKEVSDLLAKARQTSNPTERANIYSQIQQIGYNDGYSVPFNYTPALTARWNYVQNWRTLTVGWWWLDQVWLDK
jgi:peptide/nickel transport system substrate-binding protein